MMHYPEFLVLCGTIGATLSTIGLVITPLAVLANGRHRVLNRLTGFIFLDVLGSLIVGSFIPTLIALAALAGQNLTSLLSDLVSSLHLLSAVMVLFGSIGTAALLSLDASERSAAIGIRVLQAAVFMGVYLTTAHFSGSQHDIVMALFVAIYSAFGSLFYSTAVVFVLRRSDALDVEPATDAHGEILEVLQRIRACTMLGFLYQLATVIFCAFERVPLTTVASILSVLWLLAFLRARYYERHISERLMAAAFLRWLADNWRRRM